MKPLSKCRFLTLASPYAVCVSLLVAWSGIAAYAETAFPTKGLGAELLVTPMRPALVFDVSAGKAALASCAKCESEWTSHPDYTARGTIKPTLWVEHHLCKGCKTTIITAGVGRGKQSVAVHKCTTRGAPDAGCCSTGKSTARGKPMN